MSVTAQFFGVSVLPPVWLPTLWHPMSLLYKTFRYLFPKSPHDARRQTASQALADTGLLSSLHQAKYGQFPRHSIG